MTEKYIIDEELIFNKYDEQKSLLDALLSIDRITTVNCVLVGSTSSVNSVDSVE